MGVLLATHTIVESQRGAGEGNRTLVLSLEGFSSTIELHPQNHTRSVTNYNRYSNIILVEGEGFEPSKAEPSDLQSDPVDRLGIPPTRNPQFSHNNKNCVNQRFRSGVYDSRNRADISCLFYVFKTYRQENQGKTP